MMKRSLPFSLLPILAAALTACGGSGSPDPEPVACAETGAYACKTGETEPLYTFQWALNYAKSYFNDFPETFKSGLDLNVEPVHREGIKGQGINVLVVDSGADLYNEDLAPNADFSMSWNFVTNTNNPYPERRTPNKEDPHGTNVAGMIAAAQNGKGVMGISPRVNIGATNYLQNQRDNFAAAMGGAPWSSKADIFNASFGSIQAYAFPYDNEMDSSTPVVRALKKLRDGKGAILVKAAGNSFSEDFCGFKFGYYDCSNPSGDNTSRDPNIIVVAALNAFGQSSSYSSAGSIMWVSGMGGEYGGAGNYGEGKSSEYSGPTIFTTDLSGCEAGYSHKGARTAFLRGETQRNGVADNPQCDYGYMNGTSAAAPTISGVVALILSANPELTWRDVRDILRLSARKVDANYAQLSPDGAIPYGARTDLRTNTLLPMMGQAGDIRDGATAVPIDLGWQKNAAGSEHSNWYGFGVPDTAKAVALAKEYKKHPERSKKSDVKFAEFKTIAHWQSSNKEVDETVPPEMVRIQPFPYQKVSLIGTLQGAAEQVDTFQVRLSGSEVCLGSVGIAVQSPSGMVSLLKLPNDSFRFDGVSSFYQFGLSSMAFYGEPAKGDWKVFAMISNPDIPLVATTKGPEGEVIKPTPCVSMDDKGVLKEYKFQVDARIISQ